jgi:hypothetical protein
MISSGGSLRKPPLEIDFYWRILKKPATKNHGFLQAVFLRTVCKNTIFSDSFLNKPPLKIAQSVDN